MTGWELVLVLTAAVVGFGGGVAWWALWVMSRSKPLESPGGGWLCEHGHWHDSLADATHCPENPR